MDLGDGSDGCERVAGAGDEKDLVLISDVDRQGQVHSGEDDYVVEGNQGEVCSRSLPLCSLEKATLALIIMKANDYESA